MSFSGVIIKIFFALFITLALVALIEMITQDFLGEKRVECYDRYGNEIENLTCYKEVHGCGAIQKMIDTCQDNYPLDKYAQDMNSEVKR